MIGVLLGGFDAVVGRMLAMPVGKVGVMGGQIVGAGLFLLCGLMVMFRGLLAVVSGAQMMIAGLGHWIPPGLDR